MQNTLRSIIRFFMKFFCLLNLHVYRHCFIPFADQPFLTGRIEDDMCVTEGSNVFVCKFCDKERTYDF